MALSASKIKLLSFNISLDNYNLNYNLNYFNNILVMRFHHLFHKEKGIY